MLIYSFKRCLTIVFCLSFLACVCSSRADDIKPFVHPLFTDHAVLQRDAKVPVWGWSKAGTTITVEFANQKKQATADATGKWLVTLDPMPANAKPQTLTVTSSIASFASQGSSIHFQASHILVGDVWICSGQSNMAIGLGECKLTGDITTADFPNIRLLTVPTSISVVPEQILQASWKPCSPAALVQDGWGGFSAVAYFFGRELHRQLDVPVGLIQSAWGGTACEAWMSREALIPLGDFTSDLKNVEQMAASLTAPASSEKREQWYQAKDPGTANNWFNPETDVTSWRQLQLPQKWRKCGLLDYKGIVWTQRTFDVPESLIGREFILSLGPISDIDTAWVNGIPVGYTEYFSRNRIYSIPSNALVRGKNVVSVRVMNDRPGGFFGTPEQMKIFPKGDEPSAIPLAGLWRLQDSATRATTGPAHFVNQDTPSMIFNGMISPLIPYAVKGAVWYQGESNVSRANQYRKLLPAMIQDWRSRFGVGDFAFHIVSLANFKKTSLEPQDDEWAELREAQAMTAKAVPHCGIAMAIDIGDANDIHPRNKKEVGRRLALSALANTYGKKIEWSGPWFKSMTITDNKAQLTFDHADQGLVAKGGKLTGFAIAGAPGQFVWADAVIDGKTVIVSSPAVPKPLAVRYGWDANPACNLYNKEDLPAVPFRTDDWPGITVKRDIKPSGAGPSLAISEKALTIEGDLGAFRASWSVDRPERNLMLATLSLTATQATTPPPLIVTWDVPALNVAGSWVSDDKKSNNNQGVFVESRAVQRAPVVQLISQDDYNRMTVALSDALRPANMRFYLIEETKNMSYRVKLFGSKHPPLKDYKITFRIDTRALPFNDVLRDTARWWAAQEGYKPATVPETARVPLNCTWYSYHQRIDPETVINECRMGAELGLGGVIIDDGWQTLDGNRGYAFTGDWKPERIPDMKGFVDGVHALNQKFIMWYSVPMAGKKSTAAKRFEGKFLGFNSGLQAHILDPRYPEIREYLIGIYESAVRDWGIDGLKLDFIELFAPSAETVMTAENGRDFASVDEAVDRLFTDIMARLKAIKPDIAIEFRQPYNGPLMRKYGNMFRGVDCPNAGPINRKETIDLRLLADSTAVHSDPIVWHPEETVDLAARQILNVMFSVPQLSVRLAELSPEHRSMISFWLHYWKNNRELLLSGELKPVAPAANYPLVLARNKEKIIASVYQDMIVKAGPHALSQIDVINAKSEKTVVLLLEKDLGTSSVLISDCMGNRVSETTMDLGSGVHLFHVPPSGLLEIRKK